MKQSNYISMLLMLMSTEHTQRKALTALERLSEVSYANMAQNVSQECLETLHKRRSKNFDILDQKLPDFQLSAGSQK